MLPAPRTTATGSSNEVEKSASQGPQDARCRLQEHGRLVRDVLGEHSNGAATGPLPEVDDLGKAARRKEVLTEGRALRLGARAAESTGAAGHVMHRHDPLPDHERTVITHLDHVGDELVSEHASRGRRALIELEEIGAAKSAESSGDQRFARCGRRQALGLQAQAAIAGRHGHQAVTWSRPRHGADDSVSSSSVAGRVDGISLM